MIIIVLYLGSLSRLFLREHLALFRDILGCFNWEGVTKFRRIEALVRQRRNLRFELLGVTHLMSCKFTVKLILLRLLRRVSSMISNPHRARDALDISHKWEIGSPSYPSVDIEKPD